MRTAPQPLVLRVTSRSKQEGEGVRLGWYGRGGASSVCACVRACVPGPCNRIRFGCRAQRGEKIGRSARRSVRKIGRKKRKKTRFSVKKRKQRTRNKKKRKKRMPPPPPSDFHDGQPDPLYGPDAHSHIHHQSRAGTPSEHTHTHTPGPYNRLRFGCRAQRGEKIGRSARRSIRKNGRKKRKKTRFSVKNEKK